MSDWRSRSACAGHDVSIWFDSDQVAAAKAICESCDVAAECLAWAQQNIPRDDECGIWGGLTGSERAKLWRRTTATEGYPPRECKLSMCRQSFNPRTAWDRYCSQECSRLARSIARRKAS